MRRIGKFCQRVWLTKQSCSVRPPTSATGPYSGTERIKGEAVLVRKSLLVTAFAVIAILSGSVVALAAHQFTDVPDSSVFHDDIAWLADHDVTRGCNPPTNDQYCPSDPVTRGQMAAFLHRFANLRVERTIAIDQVGFQPIRDNGSYLDYDYNAVGNLGRYSDNPLGASVPVPDGATITGLTATFCDSNNAIDYEARLLRRPDPAISNAFGEVLAQVISTGDGCAVTVSTTSVDNPVVDLDNYSYAVEIWQAGGFSTNIRRVTISYDEPLVP